MYFFPFVVLQLLLVCIISFHAKSDEHHGSLIYETKQFLCYTAHSFCRDVLDMCLLIVTVYYNMHYLVICVVCFNQYQ